MMQGRTSSVLNLNTATAEAEFVRQCNELEGK